MLHLARGGCIPLDWIRYALGGISKDELLAYKGLKKFAGSYSHEYVRSKILSDSGVQQYDGKIISIEELAAMLRPARNSAVQVNVTQKGKAIQCKTTHCKKTQLKTT
jgi:hypothetical protein